VSQPYDVVPPRIMNRMVRDGDCIIFTGYLSKKGYGQVREGGPGGGRMMWVHRLVYELVVGPIPDGLTLDHIQPLCKSKACVNVDHLEPVTNQENTRRATVIRATTHCRHGHEFTEENTRRYKPKGRAAEVRLCRKCEHDRGQRRRKAGV
jgi:hypothetical protein